MPSYPFPPYLGQSPDVAGQYMAGVHAGSQIAAQQAQLQMESQRMQVQIAEQQRSEEMSAQRQQQQLEMQKAYHDQMAQLRQQQLAEQKQRVDLATQQAGRRFQAQQTYQQRIAQGEDPSRVLMEIGPQMGMTGAGMADLAKPRGEPVPVPPDPATGAPGYFKTPGGTMHVWPPTRPAGELSKRDILGALRSREAILAKDPFINQVVTPKTNPAMAKMIQGKQDELKGITQRINAMLEGAATGKDTGPQATHKDKSGEWIYLGTEPDPAMDKDPSHWKKLSELTK